eukprot:gnl/MRDRNA2_/MRDRNA2_85664_c0_seq1.p1 gnl/MRDRNA2_/MRDRNA2_85664_c0~~gnl/MRDRNA2_/MRDRNA2_85664_c0_seq1.p1  ORF type:complete len:514 (-),score=106.49 gnl/MRDRNA2_/MRDRNA2_85664_c0_seq1:584-2125(-)
MKTAEHLSKSHQRKAGSRISLEVAIAATSAAPVKQGKLHEPIGSNRLQSFGQQVPCLAAPWPTYQDVSPVALERLINPFAVRFTTESITTTFQDGTDLQDALSAIQTLPGDQKEYDLILTAPFPSIQIIRCPTADLSDHWFTMDNHRLFCLQRFAAALWPARVAAYVTVPIGADSTTWSNICFTASQGTSVNFQEAGMHKGHWDWQSAVKRISNQAALSASVTQGHVMAALAVGKDCAKQSANLLQEAPIKTPPGLTRIGSFVNSESISDTGSDCGKAMTINTQSTATSDHDNTSEGSETPKMSRKQSKSKSPSFGPTSDPEFECPPIAISLAAAVCPTEEKANVTNNVKVHDEAPKQAKAAKKKDAKKQLNKGPAVSAEEVTTLMIRGIPCGFTQEALLNLLHDAGLKEKYDFFYIPRDDKNSSNLGYAFVNFLDVQSAEHCAAKFQGVQLDPFRSPKTCRISPATIQGLPSLWSHFRKTAVNAGQHGPVFLNVKGKSRNQKNNQKNKAEKN